MAKVDYLYESKRMEYADYSMVLNDRISNAAMMYGIDSMNYMQAVDNKKKVDKEYNESKRSLTLHHYKVLQADLSQISQMFGK